MSTLIKSRKERNLPLDNLLALIIHIYSLGGTEVTFSKTHEQDLIEALSVAMFEDHKSLFPQVEGHIVTPEECDEISQKTLKRLKEIALMRKNLQKYVFFLIFFQYANICLIVVFFSLIVLEENLLGQFLQNKAGTY